MHFVRSASIPVALSRAALGLKFGCGFTRHLFHQGSLASGYRPLGGGAVTAQAQAGTAHSITALARVSIFETGSKATTTLLRRPPRRCLLFPCRRSSQSSLIQKALAASTRRTA